MTLLPRHLYPLVSALVLLTACADQGMDPQAVQWVQMARQGSQEADEALAKGETETARAALARTFEAPVPQSVNPTDRSAVHRDLCFRLSEIARRDEQTQQAVEWANRGLALDKAPDLFRVNLLVAKAKALEQDGQDGPAAMHYHDALKISETLLSESLGEEKP